MRARITRTLNPEAPEYINAPGGAANREPFIQRQMTKDLRTDLEAQGFETIYFHESRRIASEGDDKLYQFDVTIPGDAATFESTVAEFPFREAFKTEFEAVEDDASFESDEAEGESEASGESSAIAAVGNMINA